MAARMSLYSVNQIRHIMSVSALDSPLASFLRESSLWLSRSGGSPHPCLSDFTFYSYPHSLCMNHVPIALSLTCWALALSAPLHSFRAVLLVRYAWLLPALSSVLDSNGTFLVRPFLLLYLKSLLALPQTLSIIPCISFSPYHFPN